MFVMCPKSCTPSVTKKPHVCLDYVRKILDKNLTLWAVAATSHECNQ